MAKAGTVCVLCGDVHGMAPEVWNKWEYCPELDGWLCPNCKVEWRTRKARERD